MKDDNLKERLLVFIKSMGMRVSSFEKSVALSTGYIANFKGNMGTQKLNNILKTYPQLNREWLLMGKGSMIKEEPKPSHIIMGDMINETAGNVYYKKSGSEDCANETLKLERNSQYTALIDKIGELKRDKENLQSVIKNLQKTNEFLLKELEKKNEC